MCRPLVRVSVLLPLRGPGARLGAWGKGKEDSGVTKVIERVRARYEVEDVEMGKVYRWCPARVVLECTCGEELTLSAFKTTCPGCGADHGAIVHAAIVEEMLVTRP